MPSALNIDKPAVLRGKWNVEWHPVASGETFVKGDHVYLNTSGLLAIAAAADNDVGNVKTLGIADGNAADILAITDTGRRECPVLVPESVEAGHFLTQVYHSTLSSATVAASDMDAPLTLPLRNAGGKWVANKETDGTNDRIVLVERHQKYAFGEAAGWFWAKYLTSGHLRGSN